MIHPEVLFKAFESEKLSFITGVPDSLLSDFIAYLDDHIPATSHITSANEGAAIAIATGYHLSTGKIAICYMQNSGLGNALNPLISLADKEVYGIPMLLLIGWRGEPGTQDEPQHIKQGKITESMLRVSGIECDVLPDNKEGIRSSVKSMIEKIKKASMPGALLVKKGTFEKYKKNNRGSVDYTLVREDVIRTIIQSLNSDDVIISTTGKISRELYELREKYHQGHKADFLTVGSMGHSSQIALGIALQKKNRNIFCLDGDGAVIMHMGSLAVIGTGKLANFKHILLNNGAHESVGGQKTAGFSVEFTKIAKACGYENVFFVDKIENLQGTLTEFIKSTGPSLLEIRLNTYSRKDLGRPTTTPAENKKHFMSSLF